MKRLITEGMKFAVKWGLWTLLCSLLGCIASSLSVCVTAGKDYTQEAAAGIISRKGFPIWFFEAAPGRRIIEGLCSGRFDANCYVWAAFFLAIVVLISCARYFVKQRRERRQQRLEQKKTRWARFIERKGHVFLFIGAVLLPSCAFVWEYVTRRSFEYIGVAPLATSWDVMGAVFILIGYLALWVAVCTRLLFPVKWLYPLAVINGIALVFSALYVLLLERVLLDLVLQSELLAEFWFGIFLSFFLSRRCFSCTRRSWRLSAGFTCSGGYTG